MAKIKIESVLENLDASDLKYVLESAVKEILPNVEIDRYTLYRAFIRAVGRRFSTWVRISDNHIKKE